MVIRYLHWYTVIRVVPFSEQLVPNISPSVNRIFPQNLTRDSIIRALLYWQSVVVTDSFFVAPRDCVVAKNG